jgi:hypothetical protein
MVKKNISLPIDVPETIIQPTVIERRSNISNIFYKSSK